MSTTAQILEKIRDTLTADDTFVSWCRATFSTTPTVMLDFDERAELLEDYFPIVGVLSITHDSQIQQRSNQWQVRMSAGVKNETLEESTRNGATTLTYTGRLQAEDLREQAIAALYRAAPGFGKMTISSSELPHTYHPRFYSTFLINLEERI